jgi:hypothetical protein
MPENCPFDVAPFARSNPIKNDKVLSLNYTNQDFWSLKTRLVEFIRERFGDQGSVLPNTFNDLVEGSIAIMLMENWAFVGDMLSFKMDQMVNELFVDTVTEPDNAFRLCRLVGFKPTPPVPATSMWSATLNAVLDSDIVLSTPITIETATEDGLITIELFAADSRNRPQFDKDIVIPAGSFLNSSIIGIEGKTFLDNYTGTGQTLQSYATTKDSIIYESIRVRVDGVLWERVDYFSDSQPRREYRVEFDSSYRAYIMFGNNKAGLSPANGSQIEIQARQGGGTIGNIVTGYVETQIQARIFGITGGIPVTLKNYTRGRNGYDGDTVEDIRRKLPLYLRTQDRAVTGLDYKTLTDQFVTPHNGQVGKSVAVLRNHGCAGNVVDIYILVKDGPAGLAEADDNFKYELAEMLEQKKMVTDFVCLKNGVVLEVDVSVEVNISRINRKFEQEIEANIEGRVAEFFALYNWEYGKELKESDLVKALASVKQAEGFDIVFATDDEGNSGQSVKAKFYEIIRPGAVEISFMYT